MLALQVGHVYNWVDGWIVGGITEPTDIWKSCEGNGIKYRVLCGSYIKSTGILQIEYNKLKYRYITQ